MEVQEETDHPKLQLRTTQLKTYQGTEEVRGKGEKVGRNKIKDAHWFL